MGKNLFVESLDFFFINLFFFFDKCLNFASFITILIHYLFFGVEICRAYYLTVFFIQICKRRWIKYKCISCFSWIIFILDYDIMFQGFSDKFGTSSGFSLHFLIMLSDQNHLSGSVMVLIAFNEGDFKSLKILSLVHFCLHFMIIFTIWFHLSETIFKFLFVKIVSWSDILRYRVQMRWSTWYHSSITIAIITNFIKLGASDRF